MAACCFGGGVVVVVLQVAEVAPGPAAETERAPVPMLRVLTPKPVASPCLAPINSSLLSHFRLKTP